ncbi:hypothetical protein EV359DRAFT_36342 [Lentinula novae-zelandiae]|nr:hypothetical protein EV359DRAFT_36342 [Lentinula novae-zelandiae]
MPSSPCILPADLHPPPISIPTNNTEPSPPLRSPVCPPNHSTIAKILRFFGLGDDASEVRRTLVSLIWNLGWGFAQMVGIVVVLAFFAPKASPTVPGANEWSACRHLPLGIWSCLWLGRTVLACVLDYWKFTRERSIQSRNTCTDPESSQRTSSLEGSGQICPHNPQQPPLPDDNSPQTQNDHLPHTVMFKRLSSFLLMYSIYWFSTAYILVYSSINTCRFSSPHLWWLIVAVYCTMYLKGMCLILLGLVLALIFLIWRLFLRCIGLGHPSQNSQMIKADIGKLPKNLVDRIPLVVYIPTPPNASPTEEPKQIPTSIYSYSPKSPVEGMEISAKKCFRFIKLHQFSSKFNKTTNDGPTGILKQVNLTESGFWEESWDTGGYPHIVLDDNRAACAICLLDFEEPKRLHVVAEEQSKGGQVTVEVISEEKYENDELRSVDVREGAQLLRLLGCGHVFHKICLDPWLTGISGQCPVCQRQVEIPERETKKA